MCVVETSVLEMGVVVGAVTGACGGLWSRASALTVAIGRQGGGPYI